MKTCTLGEVEAAVNSLLSGYQEELNLYLVVRNLTMAQKELLTPQHAAVGIAAGLTQRADFMRFTDLLDEKEDILRIIGQIESEMKPSKSLVMSQEPETCPRRWTLATLLDRVADTIDEIRVMERDNVSRLQEIPA